MRLSKMRSLAVSLVFTALIISACSVIRTETYGLTVPQDPLQDQSCRQTIASYFKFVSEGDYEALKEIFAPPEQYHINSENAFLSAVETITLTDLMPADEWWKQKHAGTPMPRGAKPDRAGQFVYYVRYKTTWKPGATPLVINPEMLVWVAFDENAQCKIEGMGW